MPRLLGEKELVMRNYIGEAEHPENGEQIELFTTMTGVPIICYKGKTVMWNWQEIINEAVELVDKMEVVE